MINKDFIDPETGFILKNATRATLTEEDFLSFSSGERQFSLLKRLKNEHLVLLFMDLIPNDSEGPLGLFRQQLGNMAATIKVNELKRFRSLVQLNELCRQNQLDMISLKGPGLSMRLYGDPALRHSRDVDILIKEAQAEQFRGMLEQNGFVPWKGQKTNKYSRRLNQDMKFVDPERIMIEVHWRLFANQVYFDYPVDAIFNEVCPFSFGGKELNWMNPELELIYLVLHANLHAWNNLLWFYDIIAYSRFFDELDWDFIEELVRQQKIERPMALGVIITELYGAFWPEDFKRKLDMKDQALRPLLKYVLDHWKAKAQNKNDSKIRKVQYMLKLKKDRTYQRSCLLLGSERWIAGI